LGRWKVSVASTVFEPGAVVVVVGMDVVVVVEPDWMASANRLENSSSNQIRFWESTFSPS
jgi:hypothetical protein